MVTPILSILFGFFALAFGVADYAGYRHEATIRRLSIFLSLVYAQVPVGLCFILVGIGLLIVQHPISDFLMIFGLASGAIGLILIFWHPNWLRPVWLRGPLGD